jgi:hypothetical membrane protein
MNTKKLYNDSISIPLALKWIGILGSTWAVLLILGAVLAYLPAHPNFSLLNTYLSDIGDTDGWPQIIFNSCTLIAIPIRYLFLVLLVLSLRQFGAGKGFMIAVLVIGFLSTSGTALMTAVGFSQAPLMHKTGIGMYFLGVVFLQATIFFKQWSIKSIPRTLPLMSLLMVILFLVFVTLIFLYEAGAVSRATPVIWEWLAVMSSIAWMLAQGIVLGKKI